MCHSRHHHLHHRGDAWAWPGVEDVGIRAPEPEPVPEPLHLRASDAERERVVELLRAHAAEGRLSADELEERLGAAYAAQTRADLRPLLADLPAASPARPAARRPAQLAAAWSAFAAVAVVMIGLWALAGFGSFWPAWPIGIWAICLLAKGVGVQERPLRRLAP
jgi:Domain of unknown function (DUF1707)